MSQLKKRFESIIIKWTAEISFVLLLWFLGVFHFMFILVLLLIQEFDLFLKWLAEPTQAGASSYWAEYWPYWAAIYIGLSIVLTLWYFLWYRHKRPHLVIGGAKEGRVLWAKGIRRGLVYDVWDAKHYIQWKLKKNRLAPIPRRTSDIPDGGTEVSTMWPDPLAIPLGRPTSGKIIYYSRSWSIRIQRLIIPDQINMTATYWSMLLPEGYMVNRRDPLSPGHILQAFVNDRPDYADYEEGKTRSKLIGLLDDVKTSVQASASANPQLIHRDYEDGSFPIIGEGGENID